MASTTFVDGSTVIYASWLNDINNLAYLGNFPASDVTISGTLSVPVLKSSAATMTIGTIVGGGPVDIQSNGATVAQFSSTGENVTGNIVATGSVTASSMVSGGSSVVTNNGSTYGINISGNAATATNATNATTATTANNGLNAHSFSGNGYANIGGLIIQWGFANTSTGNNTITFPTPFPNACVHANAIQNQGAGGAESNNAIISLSTASFVLYKQSAGSGDYWFAIGY